MKQKQRQNQLFEQRAKGILPHIDIDGTDFTIDWRIRQLRETAAPWNHIGLRNLEMSDKGDEYYFLYDQANHQEYHFHQDVLEMPENVVFASIPYELKLDPYAAGREYTNDLKEFVRKFPIQEELKATIQPLSVTRIDALIAENVLRAQSAGIDR